MANTFHLSLDVPDLESAVAFYRELLGVEPAKEKPGYAKFELGDPPVALALQQSSGSRGLNHVGIRVANSDEVEAASRRLKGSGLVTFDERDTTCCYARQDKVWVRDPAGHPWEIYTVLADVEDSGEDERHADVRAAVACCAEGCCG
jgi:catechol 2,3-dioxygenase-like lactoylglutathione lyase family enzyme